MSKYNTQQLPHEDIPTFILLCLWILAFSFTSFSNLITGSSLDTLDVCRKSTAEVVTLHMYIVWFSSVQM